jgi:hypothetical protein
MSEHRESEFLGGRRVAGGFQDQQHAGLETLGKLLAGGDDAAHVRVFGLAQRRADADIDGVEVQQLVEIGAGAEFAGLDQGGQGSIRDIADAGVPGVDTRRLLLVEVDSCDRESRPGELDRQRQAHISQYREKRSLSD